jgi:CDP-ribitol ribitolphosphotransferase
VKIDKKSPKHWLALIIFTYWTVLAIIYRWVAPSNLKKHVLLYGHKLNGNLLSIYNELLKERNSDIDVYFLTLDHEYHQQLKTKGVQCILATSASALKHLISTKLIISDHGLHSLILALKFSTIKFADVWHGIPYKGFTPNDFKVQHAYNEIWVSSEYMKNIYINKFKFLEGQVKVTGYGRTDSLVTARPPQKANKELDLPSGKKIVLFAPTWKQDCHSRSLFPFGLSKDEFFGIIREVCIECNAVCILRTHLNTDVNTDNQNSEVFLNRHHKNFPDTEKILEATDILICDWSSIAFDFLVLNRPTLFLDTPPPFINGLSVGAEHRFGDIISSSVTLRKQLKLYLNNPTDYHEKYSRSHRKTSAIAYGDKLDGRSARRYISRIRILV